MSYDDDIQRLTEIERITNGKSSHFDMDEASQLRRLAYSNGIRGGRISRPNAGSAPHRAILASWCP